MGPAKLKAMMKDAPGLRVGIIASNDYPHWGGSEDLWLAATPRLAEAGIQVFVTAPGFARENTRVQELMRAGVKVSFRVYQPWNPFWRHQYRKLREDVFYNWLDEVKADFYLI